MKAVLFSVVLSLFAAVPGLAQECASGDPAPSSGAPALKVESVSIFDELSDQSTDDNLRVFVLRFNREVRNRSGFVVFGGPEKPVRLPIRSTVSEDGDSVPAYDQATHQLEVREYDVRYRDELGDSAEEHAAFFQALKGKPAQLELEACTKEFNPLVTELKDAHYLDPDLQRPGHRFEELKLGLSLNIPYRTNGDFRASIRLADGLKYVSFFLYPRNLKAPENEAFLANKLRHSELTPEQIGQGLAGRRVGLEASGGVPWQHLSSPFPQGH